MLTPLKTRSIGSTGLSLTELGLGGAPLGNLYRAVSRTQVDEVLTAAWDAGIRYFDTAPLYGSGLSERRMGDFLQGKPRDAFVLSTKVGRLLRPVPQRAPDPEYVDPLPFAVEYDYGHDGVLRSLEFSLARLGLSRVDILLVHDLERLTHGAAYAEHLATFLDGGLRALDALKADGTVGAYGLGVNEVSACLEVLTRAPLDVILLAGRYTLLDRSAEAELLPLCERAGTSLVIGGVFNSGILATGAVPGARFNYREAPAAVVKRVRALQLAADELSLTLPAAALQFPLRRPVVASVLIGTAERPEFEANLAHLGTRVPEAAWSQFDA